MISLVSWLNSEKISSSSAPGEVICWRRGILYCWKAKKRASFLAFLITMAYAFYIKRPTFQFTIPHNVKSIMEYSFYIILSGSVANLLLDGDKMILNQYMKIENIAYYSVATYIALVISVPSRAMHQIVYPITAKLMHENKHDSLNDLYKKTSINLQMVGGFVMLCIFVNIDQLY